MLAPREEQCGAGAGARALIPAKGSTLAPVRPASFYMNFSPNRRAWLVGCCSGLDVREGQQSQRPQADFVVWRAV